jgi:DNA-binding ferritin-like protein (Dps family)
MYSQITPTFPDAPHDVPHDIPQAIKDELEDIINKMAMMMDSRPEHLCEDEFFNENSQELTTILFNKGIPIEIINKVLNQYTELYEEMKKANDEMIGQFTAKNFIQVLLMKFSEELANEEPVRKKPRV